MGGQIPFYLIQCQWSVGHFDCGLESFQGISNDREPKRLVLVFISDIEFLAQEEFHTRRGIFLYWQEHQGFFDEPIIMFQWPLGAVIDIKVG